MQSCGLNGTLPGSWYSKSEKAQQRRTMHVPGTTDIQCSWRKKKDGSINRNGKEVVGGKVVQIRSRSQNTFNDR